MLEFPLHDGFFPQIALSREEVKYYKRLGRERLAQLIRIIEDADCAYKWTSALPSASRSRLRLETKDVVTCQRANFLDFHPSSKSIHASTLLKASVQLSDTRVDEILRAIAKLKTKDVRKLLRKLHGDGFVDGRTLFTFPQNVAQTRSSSYRAIKWHAVKTQRRSEEQKTLDFCYLEYAGRKKPHPGSNVVGFCIQESISRDREVPTLENFGVARGYLLRMGIIVSKTHQPNTFRVTSICQIDGDLNPLVRGVFEQIMQKTICAVAKIPSLVIRQRVSSLRFVEQWQWVPNSDRKACAVCLRGFYFRRKHHCRTCGEVVCSSCAQLRELEEPIFDITHLRVCSACMTTAGAQNQLCVTNPHEDLASSTSNETESYIRGLRSPHHNSYEDMVFQMREAHDRNRQSDLSMELLESELKPALKRQPSAQMLALTDVVTKIRDVRDTINFTMSDEYQKSDRTDEFNDMYSEITSIRQALESSVSNFDAALANATNVAPAMYYTGLSDRSHDSMRNGFKDDEMTPEQFQSVAKITFAAAKATKQAGQAFLSTFSDTGGPFLKQEDEVSVTSASIASYPTIYDSEDSTGHSPDPYSASNYDKIMATYQPEEDDEKVTISVRRATEITQLEKKIRDLQRSLDDAQRKLSVIDSDEPEPERQRLEAVQQHSAQVEIESVFEIFGKRGEENAVILQDRTSSVSSGPRAMSLPSDTIEVNRLTTQDLVSELRGVMASSETPIRSNGSRKSTPRSSSPAPKSSVPALPPLASKEKSFNDVVDTKKGSVPVTEEFYLQGLGATGSTKFGDDDDVSSSDEESYDDSSDNLSLLSSEDFHEPQFKKYHSPDAFYVEEDLSTLLKKRKATGVDTSSSFNPTSSPAPVGKDERDELRELMAGLVRRRSASLPFQSSQMGGVSSGEPQDYEKPSWSDDAPDRVPTVHQIEQVVQEIRNCLASCRCECPSDIERSRKLTSIFKVLGSLHREGVRSKFRTLQHDDIRYSKMLEATPSIIKLLKLAGYVSLQQKLTMRRVDQDYLALFLRELDQELHSSSNN